MKLKLLTLIIILFAGQVQSSPDKLVWPAPPDKPRVEFINEILVPELEPQSGIFGKIIRFVGGKSEDETLSLPFDLVVSGDSLFMICQNIPSLIYINKNELTFKFINCNENPFIYPVSLCQTADNDILIADPEAAIIYIFQNGKVTPIIKNDLVRPTGVGAIVEENKIYVIDTGDHSLKIFNYHGILINVITEINKSEHNLHFPTFAAIDNKELLVNDALNFSIRRFDTNGKHLFSFGSEGDTPGHFGRPKGMSVDSDGHIYVVDNLFDNIQIFDKKGRVLLVIGSRGKEPGEFWSPAGIDIDHDTIYVADTYNNRIQILRYMGGSK